MSTLDGARASRLSLYVPEYGSARADVVLEGGAIPTVGAASTLVVGDLTMAGGVILRSGEDAPGKPHAVWVNGQGWERALDVPPSYQEPAGVKLSSVLLDLAKRAGQAIELPADSIIGTAYACPASRPGEPLRIRDALAALTAAGYVAPWRVDPDGVTRFGPRAGTAITARATPLRADVGVALTVEGIDTPAPFLPGNTVNGITIRTLVVREEPGNLFADVYGDAPSILTSILRGVANAFPVLFYGYARTYTVAAANVSGAQVLLDLSPPPDAPHLPTLRAVEQWTLGGAQATPAIGSLVLVQFRDANPTRPIVTACSRVLTPSQVVIDASASITIGYGAPIVTISTNTEIPVSNIGRPVRYGDIVTVGPSTGAISTVGPVARIQM